MCYLGADTGSLALPRTEGLRSPETPARYAPNSSCRPVKRRRTAEEKRARAREGSRCIQHSGLTDVRFLEADKLGLVARGATPCDLKWADHRSRDPVARLARSDPDRNGSRQGILLGRRRPQACRVRVKGCVSGGVRASAPSSHADYVWIIPTLRGICHVGLERPSGCDEASGVELALFLLERSRACRQVSLWCFLARANKANCTRCPCSVAVPFSPTHMAATGPPSTGDATTPAGN
ncbi:hypothetical protein MRX96_010457 [Rhipicephalus microplus]